MRWGENAGRFKREGTRVHLGLIHVVVWQKPIQHCKTITLQLKINLKNSNNNNKLLDTENTPLFAREQKMDAEGEKVKIKIKCKK